MVFLFIFSFNSYAKLEDIFEGQTSIESPFELRDPFFQPLFREKKGSSIKSKVGKGVFSNVESIGQVDLEELVIVGVIIGKNRRAFAKLKKGQEGVMGDKTFILKEGMKLGENQAELKAILPGGIILVEKITNIYGEEEYLETVIPLSK